MGFSSLSNSNNFSSFHSWLKRTCDGWICVGKIWIKRRKKFRKRERKIFPSKHSETRKICWKCVAFVVYLHEFNRVVISLSCRSKFNIRRLRWNNENVILNLPKPHFYVYLFLIRKKCRNFSHPVCFPSFPFIRVVFLLF